MIWPRMRHMTGVLLLTVFLLATVLMIRPPEITAKQGGTTEVLPVQKAAPAAVVIETVGQEQDLRKILRTKNKVEKLASSRMRFSEAPIGSYGFIAPSFLGMALATQSPDLILEQTPPSANAYEIHKVDDGNGLVVGFLGKAEVEQIKPKDRFKTVRVSLHSNPIEAAPLIVAVPLVKLMADQMPRHVDRKKRDGPVLLEMDLQGTGNRKRLGE
ncbi:MAG: hypothetical protein OEY86_12500 [Nitrospira sp.]|nr:hypothetical protein [Nitrospira sp.]